jgi:hypothetical protein
MTDKERFPEIFATNHVNRRGAKRVVPMKVLVLGIGRTGTACEYSVANRIKGNISDEQPAIWQALQQLSFNDVYHMLSIISNPPDIALWREAIDAKYYGIGKPYGKAEWDALLGHCMVFTLVPFS